MRSGLEGSSFNFLVADCFGCVSGCNFWKSGSPASLVWWVAYRCLLCKVIGPLSVAGLQISFLMTRSCDKYFVDGTISAKQSVVVGEKMQRLDSLCCTSEPLQVPGMNISVPEHLNINTPLIKHRWGD